MNVNVNLVGPVNLTFKDKVFGVSWNRTYSKTLNEKFTLANVKEDKLNQVVKINGPFDLKVSVNKVQDSFVLNLAVVIDGTDFSMFSKDYTVKFNSTQIWGTVLKLNVRGLVADIAVKLTVN